VSVPTILITGPSGVGKTTVASEVGWILGEELDLPHALIEMDFLSVLHPMPEDDVVRLTNLRSVWATYRTAGAERLLLVDTLESAADLRALQGALPDAEILVIRLVAPLTTLRERVSRRELGGIGEPLHHEMAERHVVVQADLGIEEHVVEADDRRPNDIAREIVALSGWAAPT
jgi:broad-specificity NMP kinase